MRLKKITICGFGLIGGCMALDLLKGRNSYEIVAYDKVKVLEKLKRSRKYKVVVEKNFNKAIENSDIIILSATHKANEMMLEKLSKIKSLSDCLILDTGAVKSPITKIAQKLNFAGGTQFLPTHPMAGREKSGYENSADNLFKDHAWYVSDDVKLNKINKQKLNRLIRKFKALPVYLSSNLHDELVSEISHLPQLISTILGAQVNPKLISLAGPGLCSMLRLAGSPHSVWSEIIGENKEEIIKSLILYKDNLNKVIELIEKNKSLKGVFSDAARSYKCL